MALKHIRARLGAWITGETRAYEPSWAALGGPLAGIASLRQAAEGLATVQACVSAIATALASASPLIYRRGGVGVMSFADFIEHVVSSTLLTGNGLAEIIRDGGTLSGLRWHPWNRVTVVGLPTGRLAYDVTEGHGRVRRLLQDEVLHLRDRTDDGLVGHSRLSRGASAVEAALAANEFSRAFMANGASPSGAIQSDAPLTLEQMERLRVGVAERHGGTGNAGRIMLLQGGMKWQSISISPEDAELLESRKFSVEEICRLYQVPPPMVQDYSHNTFTNSETAGRWFAQFTLTPWARKIEAEFARSVFPAGGPFELELDLATFLRGDPATRWAAHAIALEHKVLTPDEVRQVEGWNRRAGA